MTFLYTNGVLNATPASHNQRRQERRLSIAVRKGERAAAPIHRLTEKEIDCIEAAAMHALTLHYREWSDPAVEWLTPWRKTWRPALVTAGVRFPNDYSHAKAVQSRRCVAVGPRFLNGYSDVITHVPAIDVAVGPRFLNGYSARSIGRHAAGVAVGPRFLNGYSP